MNADLTIGLDPDDRHGYRAIAETGAILAERKGLEPAADWTGRQVLARYFVTGFGSTAQRAALLPPLARGEARLAVAISEPGVGAHPKRLTTRADSEDGVVRINGRKAWVTGGPQATHFIVLAVTGMVDGRKRYGAFLVPRDTAGLAVRPMPELPDGRHCVLELRDCRVPDDARVGPAERGYETMARPFRDVEDAIGLSVLAGAFRGLLRRLAQSPATTEADLSLGGLAALTAVLADGAAGLADALDAGRLAAAGDRVVGLRLLAAELAKRVRVHAASHGPPVATLTSALARIDLALSVATGPRQARQARLGVALRA